MNDDARARAAVAIADIAASGETLTVARVRAVAQCDQIVAAEVLRSWRDRQGAMTKPAALAADEVAAVAALRRVIVSSATAAANAEIDALMAELAAAKSALAVADARAKTDRDVIEGLERSLKLAEQALASASARADRLAEAEAELVKVKSDLADVSLEAAELRGKLEGLLAVKPLVKPKRKTDSPSLFEG